MYGKVSNVEHCYAILIKQVFSLANVWRQSHNCSQPLLFNANSAIFSAISWREQVDFKIR